MARIIHSLDEVAPALQAEGGAIWDDALGAAQAEAIRGEVLAFHAAQHFSAAGVGPQRHIRKEIRSDHILWLLPMSPGEREFVAKDTAIAGFHALLQSVSSTMSQAAFVRLDRTEMMASHYPPGAFYVPHVDRFSRQKGARRQGSQAGIAERYFTYVFFLNSDWSPGDGGELCLYGDHPCTIEPRLGRLAIFHTPELLHEVKKAAKDRFALTGWLGTAAVV